MEQSSSLQMEVAHLIVDSLNLEIAANEIEPNAPLFREGLGLDSIDMLEMALAISKKYGFQLKSDDANNADIFSSLSALTGHIQQARTK